MWQNVYMDTAWEKKKGGAVWRGVTTGCHDCWPHSLTPRKEDDPRHGLERASGGYGSRANLVRLWWDYSNRSKIDVAVTKYVQGVKDLYGVGSYMTTSDMMAHKMIIVAEGNDVATGLKWAMLSDSAVIMTRPSVSSWMMEEMLVPGVHYIEVQEGWGDLEDKVNWCRANDEECREIGRRGRCWMEMFFGEEEAKMVREVVERAVEMQGDCRDNRSEMQST